MTFTSKTILITKVLDPYFEKSALVIVIGSGQKMIRKLKHNGFLIGKVECNGNSGCSFGLI